MTTLLFLLILKVLNLSHLSLAVVQYIENTRCVSFDSKLIRQGFENACCIARFAE